MAQRKPSCVFRTKVLEEEEHWSFIVPCGIEQIEGAAGTATHRQTDGYTRTHNQLDTNTKNKCLYTVYILYVYIYIFVYAWIYILYIYIVYAWIHWVYMLMLYIYILYIFVYACICMMFCMYTFFWLFKSTLCWWMSMQFMHAGHFWVRAMSIYFYFHP